MLEYRATIPYLTDRDILWCRETTSAAPVKWQGHLNNIFWLFIISCSLNLFVVYIILLFSVLYDSIFIIPSAKKLSGSRGIPFWPPEPALPRPRSPLSWEQYGDSHCSSVHPSVLFIRFKKNVWCLFYPYSSNMCLMVDRVIYAFLLSFL